MQTTQYSSQMTYICSTTVKRREAYLQRVAEVIT
jgi:hypothetical protein